METNSLGSRLSGLLPARTWFPACSKS